MENQNIDQLRLMAQSLQNPQQDNLLAFLKEIDEFRQENYPPARSQIGPQ